MSAPTVDAATKQAVKGALVAQARQQYAQAQEQIASEHAAAEVDQDTALSVDDLSQADAAGDLTGLLEAAAAHQEASLAAIEALDMTPTDTVRPGAIVGFDGGRYVVGVVADEFACGGVTYEGISPDSPIGAAIAGLRAGDTFTVGDRKHTLDVVA